MQPTLYQFFRHQLRKGFGSHGLAEPATVDYLSELLTRFADSGSLYAVRDGEGKRVEYLVDLFAQAWGAQTPSADWRRRMAVLRHIGEYSLFMSGLFRERLRARGELHYYRACGEQAFRQYAHYEANPQRRRLFQGLHLRFGRIADALHDLLRRQLPATSGADTRHALLASLWRV